jgi:hypothetical protein
MKSQNKTLHATATRLTVCEWSGELGCRIGCRRSFPVAVRELIVLRIDGRAPAGASWLEIDV